MKPSKFDHKTIEAKWRDRWEKEKIYQPDLENAKKPFYNLMMFPYPSAEGLHVGNVYAFTGADVYGRFKRMEGNDVFEPIGLDGFGIHSENYALKIGKHPMDQAKISEKNFYRQLHMIGNSFDWSKTLETYDPDYYKWTQWIFVKLFKAGLAEKRKAPVNWCSSCKTVLADEQVISGECERCGSKVETKELEQWFFKITDYAERLLQDLKKIDWSEKVVVAQRNWIGKSEGLVLNFDTDMGSPVEVFTTRPDTFHGVTFIAISPHHPLLNSVKSLSKDALEYVEKSKVIRSTSSGQENQKSKMEEKKVTGVFSGHYAIHPITKKKLPIWIADYVLMDYGTGIVMGVPAHDLRDFAFAKKYRLPIREVIQSSKFKVQSLEEAYEGAGKLINSGEWNGWEMPSELEKVFDWLEEKGFGKRKTNYHLRDWLISRQRYWGVPIPMVYCKKDGWQSVPESDLPVLLPYFKDFKPLGTGVAPLAQDEEFVKTKCPKCGGQADRETDVCDTFLDSSWYFLRYPSVGFDTFIFDEKITRKWLPVTSYIGGAEHSVLHLLYSRFITKVLFDLKFLDFYEPFPKFRAHGLLIKDGGKMSKSKGNVVNPDEYIEKFGADTLRCYLMFLGPFSEGGDFRDSGIEGMHRFLKRVWVLVDNQLDLKSDKEFDPVRSSLAKVPKGTRVSDTSETSNGIEAKELNREMNRAVKEITSDLENLRYNTAIAHIMEYVNEMSKFIRSTSSGQERQKSKLHHKYIKTLLLLLAPFAPFLAEELWEMLQVSKVPKVSKGKRLAPPDTSGTLGTLDTLDTSSVHLHPWPSFDDNELIEENFVIVVQVNGKLRGSITIDRKQLTSDKAVEEKAKVNPKISKYIEGKQIKRVIYVKGKILNFVI
ncbi:MAG: leucine--tRNA ligase [Candidatus Levybacteria bacterium]|nr:leucine--tRNA ligase [Candidatus Levybacteria bacterium]